MATVCIDCRYLGPRPSGIGELVQALVNHVPTLAPDLEFLFLRRAAGPSRLSDCANVREAVLPVGANNPVSMWLLPEIAPLDGIDLFHSPHNILPARVSAKRIATVHDIMWLTNPQWCDASPLGRLKSVYFRHGIARALRRSDRIAVVSSATQEAIKRYMPSKASRVEVTRSGVSERFAPVAADPAILRHAGLPEHAPFALVVGQFAPYKNHERALEAFARGLGRDSDAHIVFVQRQGAGAETLGALANTLGIGNRAIFHQSLSDSELIHLYSAARVLLHPSLCEGFGNPVAEAMACGCPVITSDRSAMPEVTGGAAALVDPFDMDAIARSLSLVWHNADRREKMRAAGIERARALSWEQFARENVALYRSVLSSS